MTRYYASLGKTWGGTGEDTNEILIKSRGSITISGTFVGTVLLKRSNIDENNFVPVLLADLTKAQFSIPGAMAIIEGAVKGGLYRTECSVYSSGSIVTSIQDDSERE